MGADLKHDLTAFYVDDFYVDFDGQAWRGCAKVRNVHAGAEAAVSGVDMRRHSLRTGPLHQYDHEAGREHFGHCRDYWRFRIGVRHRLVFRHLVGERMLETGLQSRLHGHDPFSSVFAFSSPGNTYSAPSHGDRKSKVRNSCARVTLS